MLKPIPIERISPPGKEEFYRKYVSASRPVVISGIMYEWPALKTWDFKYFSETYGNTKAVVVPVKNGKGVATLKEGTLFQNMTFKEVLPIVEEGNPEDCWTVSTPANTLPLAVLNDYSPPEYCAGGKYLTSYLFLSPKGLKIHLHQDLPENLYALVKGRKSILLFAPSAPVYPHSRFSKLPNFAQVDIDKPDYARFPALANAQPYSAELNAGEVLYIPSFWWHYIHNEESTIAMNFWWATRWKAPLVWAGRTFAKLKRMGNYSNPDK
jgi:hypothetical protein